MNAQEFNKLLEKHLDKSVNLLKVKGGEYSSDDDRLSHFKKEAEENGLTALQIASIYSSKHFRAIQKYVKNAAKGLTQVSSEPIEGRFHDLITYCFLMLAILEEQAQDIKIEATYPQKFPKYLYEGVISDTLNEYPQCQEHDRCQCPSCFRGASE